MPSKIKYWLIALLFALTAMAGVGVSKWNIHIQQIYDAPFEYTEQDTQQHPLLERYLKIINGEDTNGEDTNGNSYSLTDTLTYNSQPFGLQITALSSQESTAAQAGDNTLADFTAWQNAGLYFTYAYAGTQADGKEYTATADAPKNAGTYTCTITACYDENSAQSSVTDIQKVAAEKAAINLNIYQADNQSYAAQITYTIAPRPITVTINNHTSIYGEDIAVLTCTTDDAVAIADDQAANGGTLSNNLNSLVRLSTAAAKTSDADKYDIVGSSHIEDTTTLINANYLITFTCQQEAAVTNASTVTLSNSANDTDTNGTYTITPRPVTLTLKQKTTIYGDTPAFNYTDEEFTLAYTGDDTKQALVNNDSARNLFTITTTVTEKSSVGTYQNAVTATQNEASDTNKTPANYRLTVINANHVVTKRPITVTADNKTSVYGDSIVELSATVAQGSIVNGDKAAEIYTLNTEATSTSNVKDYTITVTPTNSGTGANYEVTCESGTYTIAKRTVTITWSNTAVTYNGTAQNPVATCDNLVGGDTCTVTSTAITLNNVAVSEAKNAGTYTVTATELSNQNYALPSQSSTPFTINKAALTVTADDLTIKVGSVVDFTATYSGFVNNENESVLKGTLAFDCDYTIDSPAGTYTITPKGLTSDNYVITFAPGTLTVKNVIEVALPSTIQIPTLTYNGSEQTFVTAENYSGFAHVTLTGNSGTNAGTYTVTFALKGTEYQWTDGTTENKTLEFVIGKKSVSVTWSNTTVTYNGTAQSPIATYVDVNDTTQNATITLSDTNLTSGEAINAGTYTAQATINDNYAIESGTVTFIIEKASVYKPTVNNDVVFNYTGANLKDTILQTGFNNYKHTTDSDKITVGAPSSIINAGLNYTFTFTPTSNYMWSDGSTSAVNLSIYVDYLKVRIVNKLLEYDYATFPSGISYTTLEPNVAADTQHNLANLIDSIQYSIKQSGDLTTLQKTGYITQGNTYKITYTLSDTKNIQFVGDNYCYLKYKTALIYGSSTYYTIEDAIAVGSGTITFAGTVNGAVVTGFSLLTSANYNALANYPTNHTFNISGRTLIVPYNNSVDKYVGEQISSSANYTYAALIIPDGVTLNFTNSANLYVAAHITGASSGQVANVREHGVLVNDGTINLASGCTYESYGFTKSSSADSNGIINANSGVTVTEFMYIHDWPGGTAASSMKDNAFPTNAWSIHNISCKLKVSSGANYNAYTAVIVTFLGYTETTACIIGTAQTNNCLFAAESVSADTYIIKYATPADSWGTDTDNYKALYTITGSNILMGQKDIFELYGNFTDKKLQVSVGTSIETSTSRSAPLGYASVILKSGATLTLSNSDFLFLPGTKLLVESNAVLNINSDIDAVFMDWATINAQTTNRSFKNYCVDKVDAVAIINGTVNVSGNMGGKIETESADAFISFNSSQGASYTLMWSTERPYYTTGSVVANGNIEGTEKTMTASDQSTSYVSIVDANNNCYWTAATTYSSYTVIKHLYDTQTTTSTLYYSGTAPTITPAFLGTPQRDYYDFAGWYLDSSYQNQLTEQQVTSGGTYNVYAKWTEKQYFINYIVYDKKNNALDATTYNNRSSTQYSVTNPLTLTSVSGINGLENWLFDGSWYIYNPLENQYQQLSSVASGDITIDPMLNNPPDGYDTLLSYVYGSNTDSQSAITLYTWLRELSEYTIEYHYMVKNTDGSYAEHINTITYVEGTTITLLDLTAETYNTDTTFKYYYTNVWYTDAAYTTTRPSGFEITNNMVLYSKPYEKKSMNIQAANNQYVTFSNLPADIWLSPGTTTYQVNATANTVENNYRAIITGYVVTDINGVTITATGLLTFANVPDTTTTVTVTATVKVEYYVKNNYTDAVTVVEGWYEPGATIKFSISANYLVAYKVKIVNANNNVQYGDTYKGNSYLNPFGSGTPKSSTITMPEYPINFTKA